MGAGSLYGKVQCIMGNGYVEPSFSVNRQTHMTEDTASVTSLAGGNNLLKGADF